MQQPELAVDARTAALLEQERTLLQELDTLLETLEGDKELRNALKQALADLEGLFLLVVVGEFNAGKTAVINALLGASILKEGVTPTTAQIHLIRYGETHEEVETPEGLVIVTHPLPWLRYMAIVDTPGTNAIIQRHQEITERFVPRSDLVLFVTSADRPFTESERLFLERIQQWGKKIVFIVNKVDLLTPQEQEEIRAFVEEHVRRTLGFTPLVFLVSARLAQAALKETSPKASQLWIASGFQALHTFIHHTLDRKERVRLKLSSPLGIARRALESAEQGAQARRLLLAQDVRTLENIEGQLRRYEQDMRHHLTYYLSRVDNILYEMQSRGDRFFDETIRLSRIFDLMNAERLKREFERHVIADTPQAIEKQVSALIDWMVDQEFRQWQAITAQVRERAHHHAQAVDAHQEGFESKRQRLLASIGQRAQDVVASYDKDAEVQELVQDVQRALTQTALVEVGAVGLGALFVALLHGVLLDLTGILGAGLLAAAGLYLLPARREKARKELSHRVESLRVRLRKELESAFQRELERSLERMRAAIAPYTRFVRTEQERLEHIQTQLRTLQHRLHHLEEEVQRL